MNYSQVDCHERLARLLGDTHPTPAAVDNNPTPPAPTRVNTEDFVCLLVDVSTIHWEHVYIVLYRGMLWLKAVDAIGNYSK